MSHDDKGNIVGPEDMEVQMRQAYADVEKVLLQYGATIDNIVDEVLFVTDMDAALRGLTPRSVVFVRARRARAFHPTTQRREKWLRKTYRNNNLKIS